MTLFPAAPDTGIVFRRADAGAEIRASWVNAIESPRCTMLSNGEGITIGTVEHLMAALAGAEIDNVIVELDGPEVPIMDGSSAPFLFLIECAGVVEQDSARRAIKVLKPVSVVEDGASAALLPDHGFSMSFEIDFANPLISRQDICVDVRRDDFQIGAQPSAHLRPCSTKWTGCGRRALLAAGRSTTSSWSAAIMY